MKGFAVKFGLEQKPSTLEIKVAEDAPVSLCVWGSVAEAFGFGLQVVCIKL